MLNNYPLFASMPIFCIVWCQVAKCNLIDPAYGGVVRRLHFFASSGEIFERSPTVNRNCVRGSIAHIAKFNFVAHSVSA